MKYQDKRYAVDRVEQIRRVLIKNNENKNIDTLTKLYYQKAEHISIKPTKYQGAIPNHSSYMYNTTIPLSGFKVPAIDKQIKECNDSFNNNMNRINSEAQVLQDGIMLGSDNAAVLKAIEVFSTLI